MLGILFIYFIGKQFYDLAHEYNKNKWGYAILGVLLYYVGTILGGFIIGFSSYYMPEFFSNINEFLLNFMIIPFGLFVTWLTYIFLKKNFINNSSNDNILDEGL
jgi:hypothetical protein